MYVVSSKLEGYLHDRDQAGFHRHLKQMGIGGRESASVQCIKNSNNTYEEGGRML